MVDVVSIDVGPSLNGKRLVVAQLGDRSHRDHFDTDSQFSRRKFREAVVSRFGLDDNAHEWLETRIISAADTQDERSNTSLQPVLVKMDEVQPEEISWLWQNRIPLGKLTIIAGDPGLGKSFLTIDLASRVSHGSKWFDCKESAPLGSVVVLNAEDGISDTIKPRLLAAGADCSKIIALQAVRGQDETGDYQRLIDLQRDIGIVEQTIAGLQDCRLTIIDPLSAYLGKTDSHRNSDVRAVLAPLAALAGKYGVAVVAVDHLTKGEAKAIYKVTGSIAFTGAARSVWAVTRDKDDPTERRRLFLPIKSNLAEKQPGLAYVLSPQHGVGGVPCVAWEPDEVSMSADEAMSAEPRRRGPEAESQREAEGFLRNTLADGAKPAREVEEEALQRFGIAKRTLDRARKSVCVEAFRPKNPGPWMLRLSTPPSTPPFESETQTTWQCGNVSQIHTKTSKKSVNGVQTAGLFVSGSLPNGDGF